MRVSRESFSRRQTIIELMSLLRLACVLTLAIWIGGLAVLGFVAAPTIFHALEAADATSGRTLAGLTFGAVFDRFLHVSWGLGLLMIALLGARAALGPRPRRLGVRIWTVTGMLALSLVTGFFISPRINTIRDSVKGAVAALPDDDARKVEFGRLHGLSNGIMLVTIIAGVGLIWMELRDQ
jgi:uncharacterized membrane protein